MSMKCITCDKQDTEHSKKLWQLHQKKQLCVFCNKDSSQHSEKLWEIHEEVVPKNTKLATMQIGFGPDRLAKIVKWNTVKVNGKNSPYHIEYVPIYMLCGECGATLGNEEEQLADVLDKTCLQCFYDMTGQESTTWCSKPWWEVNSGKYVEG